MLLNPFFDLSWAKDGAALALHESTLVGIDEDEDDFSSGSGSSRSSNNSLDDENRSGSLPENVKFAEIKKQQAKHFSAKRHSKECLQQLRTKIDLFLAEKDQMMRKNF